ncbi:hypothetical protein [Reinekea sp.]|jgi:hypothetical protein|uniref:hypothetical protein n=1 Tax=Reinekea sp. TaxID=1970455 RepID=UPI0039893FF0
MKKVFLTLVIGLIVAAGASYFGMQWKIDKAVKDIVTSMRPFVDASYESVKIGLDGRISINKLNFYEANSATNISIGSIGLKTSNLLETIKLESSIKAGKLPKALMIDIQGLDFDIPRTLFSQADAFYPNSKLSQVFALGCGQTESLGPMQFYDLGFNSLMMDIETGYTYEMSLDEFVTTSVISIDGMGAIESEQTMLGMLSIMENFQSVLNFNYDNVNTQTMRFNVRDYGFNNKLVEYCANKAKVTNDEWRDLHADMVTTAFAQLDFNAAFDLKETYKEFVQPGVEVEISLQPLPGFELSQLEYYTLPDLISLSNLQFTLNDAKLDLTGLSYNIDGFDQLNLKAVRLAHKMSIETDEATAVATQSSSVERKLLSVPKSELSRYSNRKINIERTDGQVFIGTITSVRNGQVQIRIRQGSGYTDLLIDSAKIRSARIYPE